jgi:SOUL heme-binding protein
MKKIILLSCIAITLGGCSIVAKTPEPSWTSLRQEGDIEIRSYDPMILAEVTTKGERYDAINAGFRILAGYIFGGNQGEKKLAMTAPVMQQPEAVDGQKLAMTAPVIQQTTNVKDEWKVGFVMPADYTLDSLPVPNDGRITFTAVAAHKKAVIRFTGFNTDKNLQEHYDLLTVWMAKNDIKASGQPVYAFYNPPWTPFFLKRNEILLDIKE